MLKIPKPMSITQQNSSADNVRHGTNPTEVNEVFNKEPLLNAGTPSYAKPVVPKPPESSDDKKTTSSLRGAFARIKKIKNIEIYAAIAVVLVMVIIYMTTISGGKNKSNSNALTTMEESYVREMETKLVDTLSCISGAGKVKAMVTAVGSATLEIAYNIDERTTTSGGSTTTTIIKTPVLVNGKNGSEALILFEIKPQLKGVVIVASGASNPSVRLNILRAVQVLVSDPSVNIEVLA